MIRTAAVALVLSLSVALSLAQAPPEGPPPGHPGQGPSGRGGFAPPPFPGDSMAAQRDSMVDEVMKSIAGREQMPAESVFKDIQIFKGRPAGSIPRVMNFGFGRSLGVGCEHCHARNDWAKDEKKQKRIARDMLRMVTAINNDYLWKIEGLGEPDASPERRPTVNCSTCHRGSIHANPERERPGAGPRPGRER